MLPTDLRPEEPCTEAGEVWLAVYLNDETPRFLYDTRVSSVHLSPDDLQLLYDSLDFILNKYSEALDYIKSKQNNL